MVYVVQGSPAVKMTVIYGGDVEAELIIHCFLSVADVIQYTRYTIQSLEHSVKISAQASFGIIRKLPESA